MLCTVLISSDYYCNISAYITYNIMYQICHSPLQTLLCQVEYFDICYPFEMSRLFSAIIGIYKVMYFEVKRHI